jgi:hypothetical protein
MPENETVKRAKKDKPEGKAPTTDAGEFLRDWDRDNEFIAT